MTDKQKIGLSWNELCPSCIFYDSGTGVCSNIHENIRSYPGKFLKKCSGKHFTQNEKMPKIDIETNQEEQDSPNNAIRIIYKKEQHIGSKVKFPKNYCAMCMNPNPDNFKEFWWREGESQRDIVGNTYTRSWEVCINVPICSSCKSEIVNAAFTPFSPEKDDPSYNKEFARKYNNFYSSSFLSFTAFVISLFLIVKVPLIASFMSVSFLVSGIILKRKSKLYEDFLDKDLLERMDIEDGLKRRNQRRIINKVRIESTGCVFANMEYGELFIKANEDLIDEIIYFNYENWFNHDWSKAIYTTFK